MPLADLANNNLFWQYIAAAAQDIGSGKPIGTNVNAVTQQTIATRNKAKQINEMLASMLSGEVPGGKMSVDDKGVKLHLPKDSFDPLQRGTGSNNNPNPLSFTSNPLFPNPGAADLAGMLGGGGWPTTPTSTSTPAATPTPQAGQINPFGLGQLSTNPSDLAGLTPGDVTEIANLGMQNRNAIMEAMLRGDTAEVDKLYKQALTAQTWANIGQMGIPKDERTALIKEYEYAQERGYEGSIKEFKEDQDSGRWGDYLKAVKYDSYQGTFTDWVKDIAKAGSTNIYMDPEVRAYKTAVGQAKAQPHKYFGGPEFSDDMLKFTSSKDFKISVMNAEDDDKERLMENYEQAIKGGYKKSFEAFAPVAAEWNYRVDHVQDLIKNQKGVIENVRWADGGKTIVYTVKWNDKTTSEVRYASGKRPY